MIPPWRKHKNKTFIIRNAPKLNIKITYAHFDRKPPKYPNLWYNFTTTAQLGLSGTSTIWCKSWRNLVGINSVKVSNILSCKWNRKIFVNKIKGNKYKLLINRYVHNRCSLSPTWIHSSLFHPKITILKRKKKDHTHTHTQV